MCLPRRLRSGGIICVRAGDPLEEGEGEGEGRGRGRGEERRRGVRSGGGGAHAAERGDDAGGREVARCTQSRKRNADVFEQRVREHRLSTVADESVIGISAGGRGGACGACGLRLAHLLVWMSRHHACTHARTRGLVAEAGWMSTRGAFGAWHVRGCTLCAACDQCGWPLRSACIATSPPFCSQRSRSATGASIVACVRRTLR